MRYLDYLNFKLYISTIHSRSFVTGSLISSSKAYLTIANYLNCQQIKDSHLNTMVLSRRTRQHLLLHAFYWLSYSHLLPCTLCRDLESLCSLYHKILSIMFQVTWLINKKNTLIYIHVRDCIFHLIFRLVNCIYISNYDNELSICHIITMYS